MLTLIIIVLRPIHSLILSIYRLGMCVCVYERSEHVNRLSRPAEAAVEAAVHQALKRKTIAEAAV